MASKKKPVEWCPCEQPVRLTDSEGVPFCVEGICQACSLPIKRRLPGAPVQDRFPFTPWTGPGPCPRPPEVETAAYARGRALTSAPEAARPSLRRAAPSPTSALAKPCRDPEEARALLRRLRASSSH